MFHNSVIFVYEMWLSCFIIALLKKSDDQQQRYDKIAAYVCIILLFIIQSVFAAVETLVCVCVCVCLHVCVHVCVHSCTCVWYVCICIECMCDIATSQLT